LYVVNAEYSSTSFSVSRVSIGGGSFLGNHIAYPAGAKVGDNCLLATKVAIPLDGEVREGVGLLGSPCFEIPRSVARDSRFDHLATGEEFRRRLARKTRYDARSMGVFLGVRWLHGFLLLALSLTAVDFFGAFAEYALAAFFVLGLAVTTGYYALVERALVKFGRMQPQYCSIYDPYFWWHERWWKAVPYIHLFAFSGTPFMNVVSRLRGAQVGRRVFNDGCVMTEPTLIAIGDESTFNLGNILQCHSQEDGTF
jgi:non-ribosomal peptide synthetase-like protein